jgi:hypothetical protein
MSDRWMSAAARKWRWLGVPFLLGLLAAQMIGSSVRKSATFDEPYHLVAGYAYLRTGDPRLSWEHPPLVDVLAALPLLARSDVALPLDHYTWELADIVNFSDVFLWQANFERAPELILAGRWPMMGLAVLLGLTLFLALRRAASEPAAWLGLVLFALAPNVVGNGRQVANDLGLACFFFIAVWRLGAYLSHPTVLNYILAGLAAGLTLSAKFSGVLVGPVFLLVALLYEPPDRCTLPLGKRAVALAGMGLLALAVVWAAYRLEIGPVAEAGISVPSPTYWRGMVAVYRRIQASTPTYFLGKIHDTGFWYYFPVLFLLKTPLPTLVLLGIGLARARRRWRQAVLWLVPAAVFFAAATASPLTFSYRHILPVLPFAIALAAASAPPRHHIHRIGQLGLALLVAWAAVTAARIYPHHLSFVNELGGKPENAHRLFADADWGQDLIGLRDYMAAQDIAGVNLSYFGSADPAAYGLPFRPLPGFRRVLDGPDYFGYNPCTPPPGVYAISTSSLQLGLFYRNRDLYAVFRDREPDARIGYSMHIYQVDYPPDMPVDRTVLVGPAVSDFSCEALGTQPGHRLVAKWAGAGAFVLAGQGSARYIVRDATPPSALVDTLLAEADPVADARPLLSDLPAGPTGSEALLPIRFENGLALAGYELSGTQAAPGQAVDMVTYWRAEGAPAPPLAAFVHLLNPDGVILAQWDGWPVALSGLEGEDIVVLSHSLSIPEDAVLGFYTLQVGLYRPPAGPRFATLDGRDVVRLAVVEIQAQEGDGR